MAMQFPVQTKRTAQRTLLTTFLFVMVSSTAMAQVVPSAEPDKLEQRFERDRIEEPKAPQAPLVGLRGGQEIPANADSVKFTLNDVEVSGSTVYTPDQLNALFAEKMGQEVTLRQAYEMAGKVNDQYLRDGYVLTRALLERPVNKGRVKIRVIEGYVSSVVVQNAEANSTLEDSRGLLTRYAESVRAERPLNSATLERYLLLTDDLPGMTAKAVLRPISEEEGSNELIILVGYDPFEGSYTINNRGTEVQGPWQHELTGTANSLFNVFDRTTLRGVATSPISELLFFDIKHEQQLDDNGTLLELVASHTNSEAGGFLKPLDIESEATAFSATVEHPFIRSRRENLRGHVQLSVRNSETDIFGNVDLNEDKLRVVRLGGTYDIADNAGGVNLIGLEVSQGLDMFGATDAGPGRSRFDGEADFTKFNLDVARMQIIDGGFSALLQGAAQYSLDPLLSSEEFFAGGGTFGRAYDPAEISSDHGAAAKLELRYGQNLQDTFFMNSYQLFTYYDVAAVWNEDAPTGTDERQSLAAIGLGVRANFDYSLSGSLEVGVPLTRPVALEGDKEPRFFMSLTSRF